MAEESKNGPYDFEGVVIELTEPEDAGSAQKQYLVVSDERPEYRQEVPFEFFGDKGMSKLANVNVGDRVTVSFYVGGSTWKDRRFLNVRPSFVAVHAGSVEKTGRADLPDASNTEESDDYPF